MLDELINFLESSKVVAVAVTDESNGYGRVTISVPKVLINKYLSIESMNNSKGIYTETLKLMIEALKDTKSEAHELRVLIDSLKEAMRVL